MMQKYLSYFCSFHTNTQCILHRHYSHLSYHLFLFHCSSRFQHRYCYHKTFNYEHCASVTDMQPVMFTASLCFTLHNTIERAIYGTTLSDAFINMLGRVVLSHSCHTFFVLHPRMSLLTCLLRRCSLYYRATAVVTITLSLPINS